MADDIDTTTPSATETPEGSRNEPGPSKPADQESELSAEDQAKAAAAEEERKERGRRIAERQARRAEENRRKAAEEVEALVEAKIQAALRERQAKPDRPVPAGMGPKPTSDQFDRWEDYLDARDAWNREAWQAEQRQTHQQAQAERQAEARRAEFASQKQAFDVAEKEYVKNLGPEGAKAYDEAAESLNAWLVDDRGNLTNPELAELLLAAGPQVVHELSRDLDMVERLVNASPVQAAREVGRLEARLKDGGREGRRYVAPKPPTTVAGGTGSAGPRGFDPKMSDREYHAWRKAQGWE